MKSETDKINTLVLGMGASAFGRERRAASALKHMNRVQPCFLISQWEDGSVSRLLKREGFEFEFAPLGYLGFGKPHWTLVTLLHLPELYYKLIKTYLTRRIRTILLLSVHPFINAFFALLFLKIFCRAKLVFYFGDIPKKTGFHCFVAQLMNGLGSGFVVNSLAVKQGLAALGIQAKTVQVVYNGVDLEVYERAAKRELRKEFGWPEDSLLIGFSGQINEKKGIEDFIEAAQLVIHGEPYTRFLIFGREVWLGIDLLGRLEEKIREQGLQQKIIFAGWQDNMESVYKALDIVVIPSRHEDPAPNVSLEAMASAIPIVATRVGGTPELVQNGITGLLIERQNVQALAARILELVRDSSLRKKMGEAGKRRASEMFDIRKNASLVEKILLNGSNTRT